jgi:hypothetical protein
MSLVWALCRCACGGLGMLLVAGASLPAAGMPASANGEDSAATNPGAFPAETPPDEANPGQTSPGEASPADGPGACAADQACVDDYLWSLYVRTPKRDTVSEPQHTKVTVTHKGKTTTVTKTVAKLVDEDFAWKDPKAAEVAGIAVKDFVIGGMDPGFRVTLYRALRRLDDAGFKPGIMCAFRDDYRQSIATGLKAQNDRSFHGGSFRGGYGHGVAADIVSVRGETRTERLESSSQMWDYIDRHEKELGIGRPYLDRDPPHVGPIDGEEYADHRLKAKMQRAQTGARPAARKNQDRSKAKGKIEAKNEVQAKNKKQASDNTQAKKQAKNQARNQTKNQAKNQAKNQIANRDRDRRVAAPGDHGMPMRTQVAKPPSRVQAKTRTHAI